MSRKRREWYPGAIYHIMHRGIRRKEIFSYDDDYLIFITYLMSELKRYNCTLHAYCLMSNHVHLLLQTSDEEVWKPMKNLAHNYAQYFNSRYSYCGHLFEGRYVSCLVRDDTYFLQTSRYIHLNPVKAHMVAKPEDYRWSSYRTVIGLGSDGITKAEKTLSYFKSPDKVRYRFFVEDVGHKYAASEDEIHRLIENDEEWLPW